MFKKILIYLLFVPTATYSQSALLDLEVFLIENSNEYKLSQDRNEQRVMRLDSERLSKLPTASISSSLSLSEDAVVISPSLDIQHNPFSLVNYSLGWSPHISVIEDTSISSSINFGFTLPLNLLYTDELIASSERQKRITSLQSSQAKTEWDIQRKELLAEAVRRIALSLIAENALNDHEDLRKQIRIKRDLDETLWQQGKLSIYDLQRSDLDLEDFELQIVREYDEYEEFRSLKKFWHRDFELTFEELESWLNLVISEIGNYETELASKNLLSDLHTRINQISFALNRDKNIDLNTTFSFEPLSSSTSQDFTSAASNYFSSGLGLNDWRLVLSLSIPIAPWDPKYTTTSDNIKELEILEKEKAIREIELSNLIEQNERRVLTLESTIENREKRLEIQQRRYELLLALAERDRVSELDLNLQLLYKNEAYRDYLKAKVELIVNILKI